MSLISKIFASSSSSNPDREIIQGLALYHFTTCPFCIKVRHAIKRLGLHIEQHNIHRSPEALQQLISGGGKKQVPCLRIEGDEGQEVRWLYESDAIVDYLTSRFG